MSPLPVALPVRFGAALLPAVMEIRLARRGGRAFAPRGQAGDVRVTLPEVGGVATVLVPRGFGNPLPARRLGTELRAEAGGEPCAPARWVPVGGLAAILRAVPPPRGPVRALEPEALGGVGGPWVYIHTVDVEWSAARLLSPAAGHGPVVVADRWIRAVSPAARARGVVRGMSIALAARRCPGLQVCAAPVGDLAAEVERRLGAWLGVVERRRGGFLARLPEEATLGTAALARAERLMRLLWQELGVEARAAVAATPEAARGLAAHLEPGWVGVASPAATNAWAARAPRVARCHGHGRSAAWSGEAMPDLEGAAARAGLLSPPLAAAARGGVLRVRVVGERGTRVVGVRVPEGCGRGALARLVEGVVRREGAALGPISALALWCAVGGEAVQPAVAVQSAAAGARRVVGAEGMPFARSPEGRTPSKPAARLAGPVRAAAERAGADAARAERAGADVARGARPRAGAGVVAARVGAPRAAHVCSGKVAATQEMNVQLALLPGLR